MVFHLLFSFWLLSYFFSGPIGRCFLFTSISQEKLIAKDVVAWRLGCFLHMLNLFLMLLIPILVINVKSDHIGVLGATVVTLTYSILFLKLWSYVQVSKGLQIQQEIELTFNQVNHWCRCSATILGPGEKRARWVLQNSGWYITTYRLIAMKRPLKLVILFAHRLRGSSRKQILQWKYH